MIATLETAFKMRNLTHRQIQSQHFFQNRDTFFQFQKKAEETSHPPHFASCAPVLCVYKTNFFLENMLQCSNLLNQTKWIRETNLENWDKFKDFTKNCFQFFEKSSGLIVLYSTRGIVENHKLEKYPRSIWTDI